MTRQQYTPEFKHRAVALLLNIGKSVAHMSQDIDIKENIPYNRKKRYQDKADAAFSNAPQLSEQELEIRRLKAKIAEQEEDKFILNKAAAFFAREPMANQPGLTGRNKSGMAKLAFPAPLLPTAPDTAR